MRASISTNAGQVLSRMNRRRALVLRELSVAARELGALLNAESKSIMQSEIYDVPIPPVAYKMEAGQGGRRRRRPLTASERRQQRNTTKGSGGRWQRTGALKRRETFKTSGPVVFLTNDQRYAAARYTLGTPGGRRIRSQGVRSVQWQRQAVLRRRRDILERRRRAVLRALQAR